ncbi:benzoate transporter [Candidatus Poriferisodalis sp.]
MQAWEVEFTDQFGDWYYHYTTIADDLYDTHLDELRAEGLI